jgi:hypothetical protein
MRYNVFYFIGTMRGKPFKKGFTIMEKFVALAKYMEEVNRCTTIRRAI